jgi:hypothetical protein
MAGELEVIAAFAAVASGSEVWARAVEYGASLATAEDRTRFELGDLALLVGTEYGRDRLGQFARAINRPAKQIQEYRGVCRYYPRVVRDQLAASCPRISYTHLRVAMRLHDLDRSIAALEAANREKWTVERMGEEIDRQRGKPAPPAKVWEGPVRSGPVTTNPAGQPVVTLVFLDASWAQFPEHAALTVKVYQGEGP